MNRAIAFLSGLVCFCCVDNLRAQGQDLRRYLLGQWLVMESLSTSEIESPDLSSYFRYEFLPNDTVYFGTNEFERGVKAIYRLSGTTLYMFGNVYEVERFGDGQIDLKLQSRFNAPTLIVNLVSKQIYDEVWRFASPRKYAYSKPVFNAGVPLFEYVFSHYVKSLKDYRKQVQDGVYNMPQRPPVNDKAIKVDLTVDSVGKVIVHEVTGSPRLGSLRRRRIADKLENTSGMWIPADEGGVSKTRRVTMTFVKRGNFSLKFRNKALVQFRHSFASIKKEDYPAAIRQVNEAISLVDDKFQFYVLRAVCNLKLNDLEKYCQDVQKAHALNPFVSLTNVEVINGKHVEIGCGTQ